jgi:CDP-glucose 4,6-dehydratase
VRPWQHVLEPLAGYLTVGAKLLCEEAERFAGAWNFGPPADAFIEVESFARRLQAHWGEGATEIEFAVRAGAPHEAGMLTLDSSKARQRLGWGPQLSIEQAVAMTAAWYRACAAGEADMREFTLRQIREYAGFHNVIDDNKESIRICA